MLRSGFDVHGRLGVLVACAVLMAGCSTPAEPPPATDAPVAVEAPAAGPGGEQVVAGRAPTGVAGLPTVVMLVPQTPREFLPQASRPLMDQISLTFVPGLLLVRTGQPVEFRNSEDVLHNVRVRDEVTKEGTFNVALPTGGTYQHTFDHDGFFDVGCDIHPGMSALIISASTPYATIVGSDGTFTMAGVEPGAYTVVMIAGGVRTERAVEIAAGRNNLDLTGA